jgi:hypothetical protein
MLRIVLEGPRGEDTRTIVLVDHAIHTICYLAAVLKITKYIYALYDD